VKRILIPLLIFITLLPQEISALFIGYSGESQGFGGAGVARSMDATSLLINPAGIAMRQRYTLSAMGGFLERDRWFGISVIDTQTSPLGLGVGYIYARKPDGDREHYLRVSVSEYYLETIYFGLSYRHHWFWDPSFGEYRDFPAFGLGMILPLAYFQLGLSLMDFLPRRDPRLDPRIRTGISIPFSVADPLGGGVHFDGIRKGYKNEWEIAGGIELLFFQKLFLRGGYHQDLRETRGSFHGGAGLAFSVLRMDYAFIFHPGGLKEHALSLELAVF